MRSAGRDRLPAWVVRIRSVLRFILLPPCNAPHGHYPTAIPAAEAASAGVLPLRGSPAAVALSQLRGMPPSRNGGGDGANHLTICRPFDPSGTRHADGRGHRPEGRRRE